jgi:hypothetical protein
MIQGTEIREQGTIFWAILMALQREWHSRTGGFLARCWEDFSRSVRRTLFVVPEIKKPLSASGF